MFPLCVGIGMACGIILIFWQLKRMSASPERENSVMIAIPFTFVVGVVSAYFVDMVLRGGFRAIKDQPLSYGLTFYGWLLGASGFLLIYAKKSHLSPAFMLNLFFPAFAIAQMWGRLGCFWGGCCYGCPAEWGMTYPPGSLPYEHYGATPLIPVPIYESVYLLAVFILLFSLIRFKKRAAWYLILIPPGRFVLEFFRADDRGRLLGDFFSPSQWISIFLFVAGMWWLRKLRNQDHRYFPKHLVCAAGGSCSNQEDVMPAP